jgi:hypothetical protein
LYLLRLLYVILFLGPLVLLLERVLAIRAIRAFYILLIYLGLVYFKLPVNSNKRTRSYIRVLRIY